MAAPTTPDVMNPVTLFMQADIVVKVVMVGLFLASVLTWTIIAVQWLKMRRIRAENDKFERDFWKAEDIDAFYEARGKGELPSAKVLAAGVAEWRRSTPARRSIAKDRSRLAVALHSAVAAETDRLASGLNILATVGSVAPFVGLFGTVWGSCAAFRTSPANRHLARCRRPGHRRSPVRDRDRAVRGDPRGDRLQPLLLFDQPPGSAPPALRRRLPRHPLA